MNVIARLTGAVLLPLALAGCAGIATEPAEPPDSAAIAARDVRLNALERYRVSGGFGYWDERQNLTADIEWQRTPERLDIALIAPLGLGRLAVEQTPGAARVARSGQPARTGRDASALLQATLGLAVPVPLDRLGDWIRGLPGPDATRVERDADGRLASLVWQDGTGNRWQARIRRYRTVDGLALPALLTARNGERHMKLALSDWRLGARAPSDELPPIATPPDPTGDSDTAPVGRRLALPGE